MSKLLLMRHAKSAWDHPGLADFDRPLAPRGHRAMSRVMAALDEAGLVPDRIICSTARRARETLALALMHWPDDMRIHMTSDVYNADAPALRDLLIAETAGDKPQLLALIGHNPAMEDLALMLAGPGSDEAALARVGAKFPTAAVAVFDGAWRGLEGGGLKLDRFIVPRDLS